MTPRSTKITSFVPGFSMWLFLRRNFRPLFWSRLLGVRLFRVAAKNPWCRKTPIIYKNNCLSMYFNPACWARAKQWIRAEWMKSVYIGYGATFSSRWLNLLLFSGEAACNCGPFSREPPCCVISTLCLLMRFFMFLSFPSWSKHFFLTNGHRCWHIGCCMLMVTPLAWDWKERFRQWYTCSKRCILLISPYPSNAHHFRWAVDIFVYNTTPRHPLLFVNTSKVNNWKQKDWREQNITSSIHSHFQFANCKIKMPRTFVSCYPGLQTQTVLTGNLSKHAGVKMCFPLPCRHFGCGLVLCWNVLLKVLLGTQVSFLSTWLESTRRVSYNNFCTFQSAQLTRSSCFFPWQVLRQQHLRVTSKFLENDACGS